MREIEKDSLYMLAEACGSDEIPPLMYSEYSKSSFTHCLVCNKELLLVEFYQIQKIFNYRGETTLEMAVCLECINNMKKEFSKESLENVNKFLQNTFKPLMSFNICSLCLRPVYKKEDFMVGIWCFSNRYIKLPITACYKCMEKIHKCLSKKTTDFNRWFKEKYFLGVPEDMKPAFLI